MEMGSSSRCLDALSITRHRVYRIREAHGCEPALCQRPQQQGICAPSHTATKNRKHCSEGTFKACVDPETLAVSLTALIQGGYVLARTFRDETLMRRAEQGASPSFPNCGNTSPRSNENRSRPRGCMEKEVGVNIICPQIWARPIPTGGWASTRHSPAARRFVTTTLSSPANTARRLPGLHGGRCHGRRPRGEGDLRSA
jgi:hypothetical protein